jgi:hypothetical protein
VAEESKVLGSQCDAPRCAQDSRRVLEAPDEDTAVREQIDKSTLLAAIVIGRGLGRVLLSISYNQVGPNNLNVVGREPPWDTFVFENSSG